jgi:hypothetical protein
MYRTIIIVIAFLFLSGAANAQPLRDSILKKKDTVYFEMHKSPILALGLSAVLPGAGQIYNGQWWKAPLIFVGMGGCFYGAFIQNARMNESADSSAAQLLREQ